MSDRTHKAKLLNDMLVKRYNLSLLEYIDNPAHIKAVEQHYKNKCAYLREGLGDNAIEFSAEYVKAFLISESARIILREIAPKRPKKKPKGLNNNEQTIK